MSSSIGSKPTPRPRCASPGHLHHMSPGRLLLAAALAGGVSLALVYYYGYRERPHRPAQPVPFVHSTHTAADKGNMPCLACHRDAEQAAGAGVPPSAHCLDCHRHILAGDARLAPLHAAANPDSPIYTGEPLRWVRQAPLPGHVHFHHALHTIKGISCEECHPNPDASTPQRMSDCLTCHRRENVSTDCTRCHH